MHMYVPGSARRPLVLVAVLLLTGCLLVPPLTAQSCTSSIGSNFNGTAIAGGNFVWFNAIVKVKGRDVGQETTLRFDASQITFTSGGTDYTLDVPASRIEFSPATTLAETYWDLGGDTWVTRLPASYTGNAFLSGLAFQVPPAGMPGGTNPVTWSGRFSADVPGLQASWKWAAAVYTDFSADPGDLGVKPVDNKIGVYQNSDHAGTPESFKPYVIGGARGGGGSNYTGSYSGTASVEPCVAARELSLVKEFSPGEHEFSILVTNGGPDAASGVVITDLVDPLLLNPFAYVETFNGTCDVTGQLVTCTVPSLAAGESALVRVFYDIEVQEEGSLINCATAVDSDGNSAEGCATLDYGSPPV